MVGDNIRKALENSGITSNELAKKIGVSVTYISYLLNNKRNASIETLKSIAKELDVPLSDLFEEINIEASVKANSNTNATITRTNNDEASSSQPTKTTDSNINLSEATTVTIDDMLILPIVGTIRAGQPLLATENIEGYFPAPKAHLTSDKEYFYLKVKGDSMNLKFQEGSLLLVEKCNCVENGEIAVVLINGFEATVKKVVKNNNMITLIPMSSNQSHTPVMYDIVKDEVKIIGKAKMAINFL